MKNSNDKHKTNIIKYIMTIKKKPIVVLIDWIKFHNFK